VLLRKKFHEECQKPLTQKERVTGPECSNSHVMLQMIYEVISSMLWNMY